jgi:cell wall-associated NlpC family hydrolase
MSSHDDLPGRMSQTHDLNDLQRRVQRESSACGTSSRFTSFVVFNQKIRSLPLRYLRHGFIALSIPAALVAGTVLPAAQPKKVIAPVAAAYAVQSGLTAYQGDGVVAGEAVDDEFVFSEGSSSLGSPSNTPYAPVAVGVANLRQGPGTSFARVAKLSQGQTVRLLGRSKDWYKVQTKNGTTGWLHTEVVDVSSKVSNKLTVISAKNQSASKVKIAKTTDSNVNLRGGPGTGHEIVTKLQEGVKVEVLGQQEGWFKVATPNGTVGWVTDDYLKVQAAVVAEAPAAKPAAKPAANGAIVAQINDSRVNLRKGPDTQFRSYGKMAEGTSVTVLGRNGDWVQVRSPKGTVGWVAVDLVTVPVATNEIPVVTDVPALPKVEAKPVVEAGPPAAAVSAPSAAASHEAAGIALQFVGTRYVYGGASPRGFDCSGLTQYVYRQLGVSLPHKASLQFSTRYGQRVSMNDLAPGDLVFFKNTAGRGITHVSLYVGNGMMVSANTPRTGVQYVSIYSRYWQSHYAGAIRPFR